MHSDPLRRRIEFERLFGIEEVYLSRVEEASTEMVPQQEEPVKEPAATDLQKLEGEVAKCDKCPLWKTRTNVVFGEGCAKAKLVFVGEAPGADEDASGRPFVGRAGKLLTKMIEAMGLNREDVFICNVLKCRPPGNRPPSTSEIAACSPNLLRQIEIIRPKVICALGGPASKTLLNTNEGITKLRGHFHDYHGVPLMPTFHPAYLLRNPPEKAKVWEDLKKVMALLEKAD